MFCFHCEIKRKNENSLYRHRNLTNDLCSSTIATHFKRLSTYQVRMHLGQPTCNGFYLIKSQYVKTKQLNVTTIKFPHRLKVNNISRLKKHAFMYSDNKHVLIFKLINVLEIFLKKITSCYLPLGSSQWKLQKGCA